MGSDGSAGSQHGCAAPRPQQFSVRVGDQAVHRGVVRRVDELAADPALGDQAGTVQVLHMEGQR